MSEENSTNLTNHDLWIRLIYMIIFGLLSGLARIVICLIAFLQFILMLASGKQNPNLSSLGEGIAVWTQQTYLFLCFTSEQKPYPFQDWPVSEQSPYAESGEPETTSTEKTPAEEEPSEPPEQVEGDDENSEKP